MKTNDLLASAKITSKGQITVPKVIRLKLNLEDGDSIFFFEDSNKNIKLFNKKDCKITPNDYNKKSTVCRGSKNE